MGPFTAYRASVRICINFRKENFIDSADKIVRDLADRKVHCQISVDVSGMVAHKMTIVFFGAQLRMAITCNENFIGFLSIILSVEIMENNFSARSWGAEFSIVCLGI